MKFESETIQRCLTQLATVEWGSLWMRCDSSINYRCSPMFPQQRTHFQKFGSVLKLLNLFLRDTVGVLKKIYFTRWIQALLFYHTTKNQHSFDFYLSHTHALPNSIKNLLQLRYDGCVWNIMVNIAFKFTFYQKF